MSGLLIAADISALGDAARSLGGAVGGSDHSRSMPSLGHPDGDSAVSDFHSAMSDHADRLAQHAAQGASSLQGFILAFHQAGE